MERDFLGINGKEIVLIDDDSTNICQDEEMLGSPVQWPFSNKVSNKQQSVVNNAGNDDKRKSYAFAQFSGPRFQRQDAFETSPSPVIVTMKQGNADRQNAQPFLAQYPYQSQRSEFVNATINRHSNESRAYPFVPNYPIPVSTSSGFTRAHRVQSSPNITMITKEQMFGEDTSAPPTDFLAGGSRSRNVPSPKPAAKTAQLTIFYDGSVNVYDDVPSQKAQEIMLLASKRSNPPSATVINQRPEAMLPPSSTFTMKIGYDGLKLKQPLISTPPCSPCSARSSPLSVTSQKGPSSSTASVFADDAGARKAVLPLTLGIQQEAPKRTDINLGPIVCETAVPRAIPQARKASLARFLERRKERVANAAPFPCIMKSPNTANKFDAASFTCISSSADNLSSNKSNRDGEESPSTKLGM